MIFNFKLALFKNNLQYPAIVHFLNKSKNKKYLYTRSISLREHILFVNFEVCVTFVIKLGEILHSGTIFTDVLLPDKTTHDLERGQMPIKICFTAGGQI